MQHVKIEKVIVAPVYKLEVSLEEMNDIRMAVHDISCDVDYMPATRDRAKALYEVIRDSA